MLNGMLKLTTRGRRMEAPKDYQYISFKQYWKVGIFNRVFRWNGAEWINSSTSIKEVKLGIEREDKAPEKIKAAEIKSGELTELESKIYNAMKTANYATVAKQLDLSVNTVKYRCRVIYEKLGIHGILALRGKIA